MEHDAQQQPNKYQPVITIKNPQLKLLGDQVAVSGNSQVNNNEIALIRAEHATINLHIDSENIEIANSSKNLPKTFNLSSTTEDYIPCDQMFTQLNQALFEQSKRVVYYITGIAGIGKTQLVRNYANSHHQDYSWILYFETSRSPESQYYELAQHHFLEILETIENSDKRNKDKAICKRIKAEFRNMASDWLIIIDDNSNNQSCQFSKYYPKSNGNQKKQHILIATRKRDNSNHKLHLRGFSEHIAIEFMKSHSEISATDEQRLEFAKLLYFYPLAMAQAIAYINIGGLGIAEYINQFSENFDELVESESNFISENFQGDDTKYGKALLKVLKRSLQIVYEKKPETKKILLCCTLINSTRIPKYIFLKYIEQYFQIQNKSSNIIWSEILQITNTQSLLSAMLPENVFYEIHPIIQKYIYYFSHQDEQEKQNFQIILSQLLNILSDLFNYSHAKDENRKRFEELLIHVESFIEKPDVDEITLEDLEKFAKLYYTLGVSYQHRTHDYKKSIEFLLKSKAIKDLPEELDFKLNRQLAKAYSKSRNWQEAQELYKLFEQKIREDCYPPLKLFKLCLDVSIFYMCLPAKKKTYPSVAKPMKIKSEKKPATYTDKCDRLKNLEKSKDFLKIAERYLNKILNIPSIQDRLSEHDAKNIDIIGQQKLHQAYDSRAYLNSSLGIWHYMQLNKKLTPLNIYYHIKDLELALKHFTSAIETNEKYHEENYEALGRDYFKRAKVYIAIMHSMDCFPEETNKIVSWSRAECILNSRQDLESALKNFYYYFGEQSKELEKRSKKIVTASQDIQKLSGTDSPLELQNEQQVAYLQQLNVSITKPRKTSLLQKRNRSMHDFPHFFENPKSIADPIPKRRKIMEGAVEENAILHLEC